MRCISCVVTKHVGLLSCRSFSRSNIADHAGQILHSDRLGDINIDAGIFRAFPRFRACDAGESSNIDSAKVEAAFVVTNFRGRFESVHDLKSRLAEHTGV